MYFIDAKTLHKDERGFIYSVVHGKEWHEVNYIESQKDAVRGGHYHKKTLECFFIVKGLIEVSIENTKDGSKKTFQVKTRDVFIIEPFEVHTFKILEDSAWINMLSIPMADGDKDMHRPQI